MNTTANQPKAGPSKPGLRAYFTSRSGKRFYAKDYGHKAWPIGKNGKK